MSMYISYYFCLAHFILQYPLHVLKKLVYIIDVRQRVTNRFPVLNLRTRSTKILTEEKGTYGKKKFSYVMWKRRDNTWFHFEIDSGYTSPFCALAMTTALPQYRFGHSAPMYMELIIFPRHRTYSSAGLSCGISQGKLKKNRSLSPKSEMETVQLHSIIDRYMSVVSWKIE